MEQKDVLRINELARKKKSEGLTAEETEEQKKLRAQYIAEWRQSMKDTLDNTFIEREDGTRERLVQKKPNKSELQ
ncbi:MAG: DUF896 domain-containing protein [Eubacteriales bacterium]|nr:DUF896 domain-containing protein [Eubacteriales bacterium]MDD3881008.1 DUF896 domain-containing protein [Eubacteriales bacterium]MDD4511923.1 DUF896 domain-containing protein [Eubacteriales bacterium]